MAKLSVDFTLKVLKSGECLEERECTDISLLDHILHLTLKYGPGGNLNFHIRVTDYNLSHTPGE